MQCGVGMSPSRPSTAHHAYRERQQARTKQNKTKQWTEPIDLSGNERFNPSNTILQSNTDLHTRTPQNKLCVVPLSSRHINPQHKKLCGQYASYVCMGHQGNKLDVCRDSALPCPPLALPSPSLPLLRAMPCMPACDPRRARASCL